jgi:hypothetical protein
LKSIAMNQVITRAEAGDSYGVSVSISRACEVLRDVGRLTGEIRQIAGISITNNNLTLVANPQFVLLVEGLIGITREHAEVRTAILTLLGTLDAAETAPPVNGSKYPSLIECEAVHS